MTDSVMELFPVGSEVAVVIEGAEWDDVEGRIVHWDFQKRHYHSDLPTIIPPTTHVEGFMLEVASGIRYYVRWPMVQMILPSGGKKWP